MIDAHQHFWRIERGDYGWLGPHLAPLWRDFGPEDLRPLMARTGVVRSIAVQAAPTEAETDHLLELAARTPFVAGVVGWLDMESPAFPQRLAHYAANPLFLGLRPMVHDIADDRWLCRPVVLRHLALVADAGLAFDLLLRPRHLPAAIEALQRTPGLRAVVDHLAKPEIATGAFQPWLGDLARIAEIPDVFCKISGLITEAAHACWTLEQLRPYVEHACALFGPDRLVFGSDWPVCTLAGSYAEVVNAARTLLSARYAPAEMVAVFAGNAQRLYRLASEGQGRGVLSG